MASCMKYPVWPRYSASHPPVVDSGTSGWPLEGDLMSEAQAWLAARAQHCALPPAEQPHLQVRMNCRVGGAM